MGNFDYVTIKNFSGMNTNRDVLSTLPGQLIMNDNFLYGTNGGLYERGGGAKLTSNPSGGTDPVFSLSNYIAPNGTNYLITSQDLQVWGDSLFIFKISMNLMKMGLPFGIKLDRGTNERLTIRIRDDATAAVTFNCIAYGFERFE